MMRFSALSRLIFLTTFIDFILILAGSCWAEFDGSQWKFRRTITIAESLDVGLFGLALYADVLERCRPDLKDIRMSRADKKHVPSYVRAVPSPSRLRDSPIGIVRVNTVSGSWTDIVIDKSAKIQSTGVRLDTGERDFVRRIEIRGWDEEAEEYVVRLDGLIADIPRPLPIRIVDVFHPSNTFQYLNVRIYEDGQGPLRIDRITCYGDDGERNPLNLIRPEAMESTTGTPAGTSRLLCDLGERRFPLVRVSLRSGTTEFARKAIL